MVIGFIVTLIALPVGIWVALEHTRCELGPPLATRLLSTPMMMVNVPYGGNSSAYATFYPGPGPAYVFQSGALRLNSTPWKWRQTTGYWGTGYGSHAPGNPWAAIGEFSDFNWTIYDVMNATVFGLMNSSSCTAPVVAVPQTQVVTGFYGQYLLLPNNTTDRGEPNHSWSSINPGIPSVTFDNSFYYSNYPNITTCGRSTNLTIRVNGTVSLPISVSLPVGSHNVTAYGTMEWNNYGWSSQIQTMTYEFPPNFGTWEVDSASGDNTLGALAFQYYPCA